MKKIFSLFATLLFAGSMMAASLISTFNKTTDISNLAAVKDVAGEVTWSIATTVGAGEPTVTTGTSNTVDCLKFGKSGSVYFKPVVFSTDYFKDVHVTKVVVNLVNNGKKTGTFTAKQGSITIGSASQEFGNTAWVALTASGAEGQGGTLELTYSVDQAFYISSIEVTYIGTEPNISASVESINFGAKNVYYAAQRTGTLTFDVTSENLSSDIELSLSDDNYFSIDMTTITANQSDPETVTVGYAISNAGSYSADLTLTSGSTSITIPLSLEAVNVEPVTYTKVTDASVLKAGDQLIIVEETNAIVATPMGSNSYLKVGHLYDYNFAAGTVNISNEGAAILTLGGIADAWTLTSVDGHLKAKESTKMEIGEGTWTIAIDESDDAVITAVGTDLGVIQYNASSPRFVNYKLANQTPIQLYRVPGTATGVENVEETNGAVKFFENGQLLIRKNGVVYNAQGTVVR
jgi:hypothetical protein